MYVCNIFLYYTHTHTHTCSGGVRAELYFSEANTHTHTHTHTLMQRRSSCLASLQRSHSKAPKEQAKFLIKTLISAFVLQICQATDRCNIMRQGFAPNFFFFHQYSRQWLSNWQCARALTLENFFLFLFSGRRLCARWRIRPGHGWWYADAGIHLHVCMYTCVPAYGRWYADADMYIYNEVPICAYVHI